MTPQVRNTATAQTEGPPNVTAAAWRRYLETILEALDTTPDHVGAVIHPASEGPSRDRLLDACRELGIVVLELPIIPPGALAIGRIITPE